MHFYNQTLTRLNQTHFILSFEQALYVLIQSKDIFDEPKEYLPIILLASGCGSEIGKNIASPLLKSLQLDTEDLDLSAFIYQMIFGNYQMFFRPEEENMVSGTPWAPKKHLISYLMKFPASVI